MKDLAIALGSKPFHELASEAQTANIASIFSLASIPNWRQLSLDYRQEQLERDVKQAGSPRAKSSFALAHHGVGTTPAPKQGNTTTPKLILKSESGCIRHWLHKCDPSAFKKCTESTCNFKHDLPYHWRRTVADRDIAKYFQVASRAQGRAPLEAYVEKVFSTSIVDKKLNAVRLSNMGR